MKNPSKIKAIIYGVLLALLLFEAFDFLGGYDFIKSRFYQPTEEMSAILNNLDLTGRGDRILRATNPNLESKESFNENCDSHNVEIYVLGCYLTKDDTIHLYNVSEKELDGVKESTIAHELLHAVYNRLPFWEKNGLNSKMQEYYNSLDENSELRSSMKLYDNDEFFDELHSRLGTEVKDLPESLESHYAAIFKDQDKIVDFYEKYSGTFKKYEKELQELGKKLETLQREIDEEESRLNIASADLNRRIDDYNNRINAHNYTDANAMRIEGNNLRAEAEKLNADYVALNQKVDEYNSLVAKFNDSAIHTNQIFESINSNSGNLETVNN